MHDMALFLLIRDIDMFLNRSVRVHVWVEKVDLFGKIRDFYVHFQKMKVKLE